MKGEKLPKYLTMKGLREHIVDWSDDTVRRRIKEGFPAVQDETGRYLFPTQEVLDWMKRRTKRVG